MSSCKTSNCCKANQSNNKEKTTNIVPRANKVTEKKSCGCNRKSTETKPTSTSCKPRKNSIITQCSVIRNQTKATVSAVDNKTKVVARPPLADLKNNSSNVQSSTVKNSCGAVKKVTDPKPASNLNSKRCSAPLAGTTAKRNLTRTSTGSIKTQNSSILSSTKINSTTSSSKLPLSKTRSTSTGVLPSAKINSKPKTQSTSNLATKPKRKSLPSTTLKSTSAAAAKPRKCCAQNVSTIELPPIEKSLIPIVEQESLNIPPKKHLEISVNTTRGFDCISPIVNTSFHTPSNDTTWLTFKTNITEMPSLLPFKEEKKINKIENDDSGFGLNSVPTQIIFDGIPSLKKKTLKRQISVPSGYKGIVNLDPYTNKVPPAVLYSDYMIDVIQHIIDKEEKLKLSKDFMKQSKILPIYRTAIINWLVKLHQFTNLDSNVFFLCVRLFDKLISKMEISQENLQLTGMIAYWTASKYEDSVEYLTMRKLQEISNNRYSAKHILDYEKKILNILKYEITLEDPVIFVRYYIYILKIEDSNEVSLCANYLLECLATSWDINTFPLSLQASGAVFLSLQILKIELNYWNKLEFYPGYYNFDSLFTITERILERLLLIQNESYEFREIYQKYASEKYNYISLKVCQQIKDSK